MDLVGRFVNVVFAHGNMHLLLVFRILVPVDYYLKLRLSIHFDISFFDFPTSQSD